jgi:hypothetical protein
MAIVTDLVTRFSFKGTTKPLLAFNSALSTSIGLLAKTGFAVGGAVTGLALWVNSISKGTESLYRMNYATGLSTERIKTLSLAAIQAGGDAKGMEAVLSGMTGRIAQASLQGDDLFSALGVNVFDATGQLRKADDVLFEIGKKLRDNKELAAGQKLALAGQLGIDPMTFKLITQSDQQIEAVIRKAQQLNMATQAQTDTFAVFNQAMRLLGERFEQVQLKIAVALLPAIQSITNEFLNLLDNNIPSIQKAFKMLTDAVMWFVKDLAKGEQGVIIGYAKEFYTLFVGFFSKMDVLLDDLNRLMGYVLPDKPKDKMTQLPSSEFVGPLKPQTEKDKRDQLRNMGPIFGFKPKSDVQPQSQSTVINQSVAIEVKTDNPNMAATTIRDELDKQLNMAYLQSARGVYAG